MHTCILDDIHLYSRQYFNHTCDHFVAQAMMRKTLAVALANFRVKLVWACCGALTSVDELSQLLLSWL